MYVSAFGVGVVGRACEGVARMGWERMGKARCACDGWMIEREYSLTRSTRGGQAITATHLLPSLTEERWN